MNKFERLTFEGSITREIGENEVFLSFWDDAGAVVFHEWWNIEGAKIFNDYYEENKQFYE